MQDGTTPAQLELRNFNRTLAEIEWLLLILVLVYLFVPDTGIEDRLPLVLACCAFGAFVLLFRYLNLMTFAAHWKLALESWAMIAFIAYVVFQSGGVGSPMFSLYLLVIIFSSLTLGKMITLLEVALITAFYLYLAQSKMGLDLYSYAAFGSVMIQFAPYLLVAYITSLLAADMFFTREIVQRLSETDELTGVFNMRAFTARLSRHVAQSEKDGSVFTVMMIDADNLKDINDNLGHEVGNRLIQSMVTSIRQGLRSSDIVARYGGDEFIALLPGADEDAAAEAGERVRGTVENTSFAMDGQRISTTVTIGFACFPSMATVPDDLIGDADRALYVGKKRGRNRVVSFADCTAENGNGNGNGHNGGNGAETRSPVRT